MKKVSHAEKVAATVEILQYTFGGRLAPDVPEKLPGVIFLALNGWNEAHRSLCHYAKWLTDQQQPLPHGLQMYVVYAARHGFKSRKRFKNTRRDLGIAIAITELVDVGYRPTRNAGTEAPSACSLVSEALPALKINLTERSVEQIWKRIGGKLLLEPSDSSN
jgi:hypothetical protein